MERSPARVQSNGTKTMTLLKRVRELFFPSEPSLTVSSLSAQEQQLLVLLRLEQQAQQALRDLQALQEQQVQQESRDLLARLVRRELD
jgi:hypothetical protein